jgi:hypothetical protein
MQVLAEPGSSAIRIVIGRGFHDGLFQPENVAERALVEALVNGVAIASRELLSQDMFHHLLAEVCPSPHARWMHRFQARDFRDRFGAKLGNPVLIDPTDDAAARIGLGWRVRSCEKGAEIVGINECTAYLNEVVSAVLDDLCELLRGLDRRSFLTDVIVNHEAAAHDRDTWKRTAQAHMAIFDDKKAAARTILDHHSRLNVCFVACRILMEAAICECPSKGGRTPGKLDLSRAMALALLSHRYGGWSDAIRWGAIEPRVRVTPLGDVHVSHEFMETVYEPFGRAFGGVQLNEDIESYPRLYEPVKILPSVSSVIDEQFLNGWREEFGVSVDGFRAFLEALEGRKPRKPIFACRRSTITRTLVNSAKITPPEASFMLDVLTLPPRRSWRSIVGEFVNKDWFPWRFRRRLSVLRRPLIQIDNHDDPTVLVAPGLFREAFHAMVYSFHRGEIPSWQVVSREMRKWIGHANHVQRSKFNSEVASRMRQPGWKARAEVNVTEILGRPLNRNYGGIDVLAWQPETGRVLAMECKDLQFNKTLGEVAEQLADFRGETRPDGKRDLLKKHLDRVDIITTQRRELCKTLKLRVPAQIEGHLIFKNPVAMRFATEKIAKNIRLSLFAELDHL